MTDSPACNSVKEGGSQKAPPLLFSPYRLPAGRFDPLFTEGQSLACGALVLRWMPNGGDRTRVGVIAAKRVFHLAVERSRARRLLREAFRLERPRLKVGYDLVLMGRRNLLALSCDEVRVALMKLARRAKLTCKL